MANPNAGSSRSVSASPTTAGPTRSEPGAEQGPWTMISFFSWLTAIFYSICSVRFSLWPISESSIEYLNLTAAQVKTYDEWLICQTELDSLQGTDAWLADDKGSYEWRALRGHLAALAHCRQTGDNKGLASQLRSHSSRNICRILTPSLYRKSRIRTKDLIHEYLLEVSGAVRHLARRESMIASPNVISSEDKRQLFNDVKQALGRTALVLQGGAAVSLCHFGVVKALHLQNLLPQIITGTAAGALIGALVCATPVHELDARLGGNSINLSAFERSKQRKMNSSHSSWKLNEWLDALVRRFQRFQRTGHFFDIEVLQECLKDNIGDITFAEAYATTGRILNITVALPDVPGMPQLLNYVTAPHVFVWSAVVASISTSRMMYGPVVLFCRDENGNRARFFASDAVIRTPGWGRYSPTDPPLKRVGEMFNVNHFIVSQTRPYLIPFIRAQQWGSGPVTRMMSWIFRLGCNEALHWFHTLDNYGYLPSMLSRLLLDEAIPGGLHWSKMTITPTFQLQDIFRAFDTPTPATIDSWSLRGERSVWPAICELNVRCGVEFDLDLAYNSVRRRMPGHAYGR